MSRGAAPSFVLPGWLVLLGALTAIGPLSIDMYLPSLPAIARDLVADPALVQLTLPTFLVGMALGQLVYGPLSDRYGRKPPLYAGLTLYVLASIACALSADVYWLTAARFVQALGGSAGVVIARAVIRDRVHTEEAARAFSMLMLVMGLAPILAPLLGGLVLTVAGWPWIFVSLAGFGVLLLHAVHLGMAETVPPERRAGSGLGRVFRDYGLLLRDRGLLGHTLAGGLPFAGMFAYIAGSPYVLIELYGVSATGYGWLFGLNALGLIAATQINARLVHLGPGRILARTLPLAPLAALAGLLPALAGVQSVTLLMLALFGYLACLGFIGPNAMALALASQGQRAGAASAVIGSLQFLLGTAAGVAVSLWHAPSAVPLTAVMLAFSVAGWLARRWTAASAAAGDATGPR